MCCTGFRLKVVSYCPVAVGPLENGGSPSLLNYQMSKETKDGRQTASDRGYLNYQLVS